MKEERVERIDKHKEKIIQLMILMVNELKKINKELRNSEEPEEAEGNGTNNKRQSDI